MSDEPTGKMIPNLPNVFSKRLEDVMCHGKPGDIITDERLEEIAEICCRCPRQGQGPSKGYAALGSAIRRCLNNHHVVWKRVANASVIKCFDAHDIDLHAKSTARHVYRQTKRSAKMMAVADTTILTPDEKTAFVARGCWIGMLAVLASGKAYKRIETRKVQEPLQLEQMLAAIPQK